MSLASYRSAVWENFYYDVKKAKGWVRAYYSVTYADPSVEQETGYADIRKALTPVPLLMHSYASAPAVADVMLRKYRQEQ